MSQKQIAYHKILVFATFAANVANFAETKTWYGEGTEQVRSRSCFKQKKRSFFKAVFLSKPSVPLPHIAALLLSTVFRQVYDAI